MLKLFSFVNIWLWLKFSLSVSFILLNLQSVNAQGFYFPDFKDRESLSFKLIKNLIIIELYVNDKGPFNFLLDSGVGVTLITNPKIIDSVDYSKLRKIKITGLGLEDVEAFITNSLSIKIGHAKANRIPTTIIKSDLFNLSGYLGIDIDGIIGYSFLNSFVVDINYNNQTLTFHLPGHKKKYKGYKVPMQIDQLKPYINLQLKLSDGQLINGNFLIDSGASHALSLEAINQKPFPLPMLNIPANLGMSLSGEIKGNMARVDYVYIGPYTFSQVIAGYPDFKYTINKIDSNRNGNIGADLLRRFNLTFDYQAGYVYLKPNQAFKNPFEFDMVGAIIYFNKKQNRYFIDDIDKSSPAEIAGLLAKDEIISLNFKAINNYTLNEIQQLFKIGDGKTILFEVLREKTFHYIVVKLKKRI